MLQSLYIENFAIIDKLTLEFNPGLNVLTGETGAGKSIIVESLKLLLGEKPSSSSIRSGEKKAIVEAIFCIEPEFIKEFEVDGIEVGCEIMLRREIVDGQRGKVSIDGRPITQDILKRIGERLISISSQHDYHRLLKRSVHSQMLDNYADKGMTRNSYKKAWNLWKEKVEILSSFEQKINDARQKRDYLEHEFNELKKIKISENQLNDLENERSKLKNTVKLRENLSSAVKELFEESGAVDKMSLAVKSLSGLNLKESEEWLGSLNRANAELSDIAGRMQSFAEDLTEDPSKLEEIEDKIYFIRQIEKKYASIENAIKRKEELDKILQSVENSELELKDLTKDVDVAFKNLKETANTLSLLRKKFARKIQEEVELNLKKLAFTHPRFVVNLTKLDEMGTVGSEEVEFLFSPNVGENPKPLLDVASGGELSRLHLALGQVVGEDLESLVVYDEVDSGIGGETAIAVGKLLKDLSKNSQIICITHLPQIASFGNHHLSVRKEVRENKTYAIANVVLGEKRIEEIAKLLGGISSVSIKHAEELIRKFS